MLKHQIEQEQLAMYEQTLKALLDFMLPASTDGKKPTGGQLVSVKEFLSSPEAVEIAHGLDILNDESRLMFKKPFFELKKEETMELQHVLRHKLRNFMNRLAKKVLHIYYQKDEILDAIGLGARPPFPDGYHVHEGDLTLLEDVYLRGEIYRKTR